MNLQLFSMLKRWVGCTESVEARMPLPMSPFLTTGWMHYEAAEAHRYVRSAGGCNRAQAQCSLQVGPQAIRFAACQDLSANVSTGYSVLYTLTNNGNGTSVLSLALDRPVDHPSWIAFGLPACPTCGMLNGSAVIARVCPDCMTGAPASCWLPRLGECMLRAAGAAWREWLVWVPAHAILHAEVHTMRCSSAGTSCPP